MISTKDFDPKGTYVGRVWRPDVGPALVRLDGGDVLDITSRACPTMHDLLEGERPAATARAAKGDVICGLDDLVESSLSASQLRFSVTETILTVHISQISISALHLMRFAKTLHLSKGYSTLILVNFTYTATVLNLKMSSSLFGSAA